MTSITVTLDLDEISAGYSRLHDDDESAPTTLQRRCNDAATTLLDAIVAHAAVVREQGAALIAEAIERMAGAR